MKKGIYSIIAVAMAVALLTGCVPKTYHEIYFTDYSSYADHGFFITESSTVPFDYKPIGSLYLIEHSGAVELKDYKEIKEENNIRKSKPSDYDDIYSDPYKVGKKKYKWKYADAYSAMNAAVDFAKERGGDGIMNIRIKVDEKNKGIFHVSGMIFKRK